MFKRWWVSLCGLFDQDVELSDLEPNIAICRIDKSGAEVWSVLPPKAAIKIVAPNIVYFRQSPVHKWTLDETIVGIKGHF